MTEADNNGTACPHEFDEERFEQALENTQPLIDFANSLVDASVAAAARDAGRTVEEQWDRMGDHYAYMAAEQNPYQRQLDDYELAGDTVEVRP